MSGSPAARDTSAPAAQEDAPQEPAEASHPVSVRDGTEKSTPDDAQAHHRDYPTGITRALILGPITLTYFLFFLDLAVVSTATPAITSQFNSLVDVGWYASKSTGHSSFVTDRGGGVLGTAGLTSWAAQLSSR